MRKGQKRPEGQKAPHLLVPTRGFRRWGLVSEETLRRLAILFD